MVESVRGSAWSAALAIGVLSLVVGCDMPPGWPPDPCGERPCPPAGRCGDGVVDPGEGCDDGNGIEGDACPSTCLVARCGDGLVRVGAEECDDGDTDDTDACPSTCREATCGDGVVLAGVEECDDGNGDDIDACLSTCVAAICGDGVVEVGVEGCDAINGIENDGCFDDCRAASCGDGVLNFTAERCDDGNLADGDGCNSDCRTDHVIQVAAGSAVSCALMASGHVRCWGRGDTGSLGYGNTDAVGDDEPPALAGDVDVGGTVTQIAVGHLHACALLDTGAVRCWGNTSFSQLGYQSIRNHIGDNETPVTAGDVDVGGIVVQISAGELHTCAVLSTGAVRCWGTGPLGYTYQGTIGDNETPASAGDVDLGGRAVQVAAGLDHTCALLDTGAVRCWGLDQHGQLGYGLSGGGNGPASAGDVPLGGRAIQITAGWGHSCAVLDNGEVRCWGRNHVGQLGYGHTSNIGDEETPASAGMVDVGGPVARIATGAYHTCAVLTTGTVRCWGSGEFGKLGYGDTTNRGDDESPTSAGDVDVGGVVVDVAAGYGHTCVLLETGIVRCWGLDVGRSHVGIDPITISSPTGVLLETPVVGLATGESHSCAVLGNGAVRCWGAGANGQLGYGNTSDVGDDESPASAGDVDAGGSVLQAAIGGGHTCALFYGGALKCWGTGANGQLGYGTTSDIGDDESPASAGEVNVGGAVSQIAAGELHTCALLGSGLIRCWGSGADGRLGYSSLETIGDDETPASTGTVQVGGTVIQLVAGAAHTCALRRFGTIRCWGLGAGGRLGYGNENNIGDDETPESAGDVDVGGVAVRLAAGAAHTCALLSDARVVCWGVGADGRLGRGNTTSVGDDETPASAGAVTLGGSPIDLVAGARHSCARLVGGLVTCWGDAGLGQLGRGTTAVIGDDEPAATAGVSAEGARIKAGGEHTCVLSASGTIRCWGNGANGRLGYGNTATIGDDETPDSVGDVPVL